MEYQIVSIVDADSPEEATAARDRAEIVSVGPYVPLLMFGQPVPRHLEPHAWAVIACRATDADVAALQAAGLSTENRNRQPRAVIDIDAAAGRIDAAKAKQAATDWNATAEKVAGDIDATPKGGQ